MTLTFLHGSQFGLFVSLMFNALRFGADSDAYIQPPPLVPAPLTVW